MICSFISSPNFIALFRWHSLLHQDIYRILFNALVHGAVNPGFQVSHLLCTSMVKGSDGFCVSWGSRLWWCGQELSGSQSDPEVRFCEHYKEFYIQKLVNKTFRYFRTMQTNQYIVINVLLRPESAFCHRQMEFKKRDIKSVFEPKTEEMAGDCRKGA